MAEAEVADIKNKTLALSIKILIVLLAFSVFILFIFPSWSHPIAYWREVSAASEEFGVPVYLIYAVMKTESGFRKGAVSRKGAVGLMQVLPSTYEEIKAELGMVDGNLADPSVNIRAGTYYLSKLYKIFSDWRIALAAYNAGPGTVLKWLEADPELADIPYPETKRYVVLVNRAYQEYTRLYSKRYQ